MSKGFWAVILAIVVIFGAAFLLSNRNSSSGSSSGPVGPTNHVEGSTKTGVKLVEYGDYECPYCGQFYPIVKQVAAQYNDQIQFQFRNLPLSQIHKNAFAGARAAEAAALQGKFWQMHDLLYQNQDPNARSGWVVSNDPLDDYFAGFAKQLGLNVSKFKTDFGSSRINDTINTDVAQFAKDFKAANGSFDASRDTSTPTFFLDGKQISPSYNVADFQKAIDTEIRAKTSNS